MDTTILENIGLTKSEIRVYFTLLELGSSTTGKIIEKSNVASSKIYEILDKLIQKGLVNYILKGKIKSFEASDPDRIIRYIEDKKKQLELQENEIKNIIPQLILKKKLAEVKQDAKIYRGFKGLETAFYDALNSMSKEDIFYVYGIPKRSDETNRFFVKWNKERAKKGIKSKQLFNEEAKGELQTLTKNNPLSEIKYLQENLLMPAAVNIFKNRIIIFPSETEKQPILIVIDNKEVAESFIQQFDILWNQQTRVYTGLQGPKIVFREMLDVNKEILAFGIDNEILYKKIFEELKKLINHLNSKNIPERLLFNKRFKEHPVARLAKVKYLSKEYFSPLHVEIYGKKVAIIDWNEPITTIIIDKKEIAESYRKYFNLLWNIAKP